MTWAKYLVLGGLLAVSCGTTKTFSVLPKSNTITSGTATFTEIGSQVKLELKVQNLTPNGIQAAHIHEKGDCSAADGTSAGGHWNPTAHPHGKWGEEHHHAGDLGNLVANGNGEALLVIKTNKWCLGCADPSKNILGKSIIIHSKADDFKTQPTGNAGARVGCIELK